MWEGFSTRFGRDVATKIDMDVRASTHHSCTGGVCVVELSQKSLYGTQALLLIVPTTGTDLIGFKPTGEVVYAERHGRKWLAPCARTVGRGGTQCSSEAGAGGG